MCDQDPSFLQTLIIGDDSWCYQLNSETKGQSPLPKKIHYQKSKVKTPLIVFFDCNGVIQRNSFWRGQTVCMKDLKWLLQHIWDIWPKVYWTGKWNLLHNVRPHTVVHVCNFLAKQHITILVFSGSGTLRHFVCPPQGNSERHTFCRHNTHSQTLITSVL